MIVLKCQGISDGLVSSFSDIIRVSIMSIYIF